MQKGKILLRVTGSFYIIRAALFFLICFFCAIYLMTDPLQTELSEMGKAGIPLYLLVILTIWLAGAFDLTVGILGVLRAAHPKRSAECIVLGVLTTVFEVLPLVGTLMMAFLTVQKENVILGLLNLNFLNIAIAVCYLVAAVQVRRSARQPAAAQWGYPVPPRY